MMQESVTASMPARIGLLGNPSDGYGGECISLPIWNWVAEVTVSWDTEQSDSEVSEDGSSSAPRAHSESGLSIDSKLPTEPGLKRLIEAAFTLFPPPQPVSVEVTTSIPRQVGLAGSSAILAALFYCLHPADPARIAHMVQQVEAELHGMVAAVQDSLAIAYGQMLHMDFSVAQQKVTSLDASVLEYALTPLDASSLPPLWVAWAAEGEDSGGIHSDLSSRWASRDPEMERIIAGLVECTRKGLEAISSAAETGQSAIMLGDEAGLAAALDRNFDLRRELFGVDALGETAQMVELARSFGSCAKQTGSGGAIFGIRSTDLDEDSLSAALNSHGWSYAQAQVSR
jgi:glucuronokinase